MKGFNPWFSGFRVETYLPFIGNIAQQSCFNPWFSGFRVETTLASRQMVPFSVSILGLVDLGLRRLRSDALKFTIETFQSLV